jgi:hypothetical protein
MHPHLPSSFFSTRLFGLNNTIPSLYKANIFYTYTLISRFQSTCSSHVYRLSNKPFELDSTEWPPPFVCWFRFTLLTNYTLFRYLNAIDPSEEEGPSPCIDVSVFFPGPGTGGLQRRVAVATGEGPRLGNLGKDMGKSFE